MEREREYFPCPVPGGVPTCPYNFGKKCYEDVHHLYQRQERMTKLMRIFRNLPRNTVDTCRNFHVQVLDKNALEYPSDEVMRNEIIDAEMSGEVCLSANKRRVVYGTPEV